METWNMHDDNFIFAHRAVNNYFDAQFLQY